MLEGCGMIILGFIILVIIVAVGVSFSEQLENISDWLGDNVESIWDVLLLGFFAVCLIIGIVRVFANFKLALHQLKERKDDNAAKNRKAVSDGAAFEEVAPRAYLFGPCFADIFFLIGHAIANNFKKLPTFGVGAGCLLASVLFWPCLIDMLVRIFLGVFGTLFMSVIVLLIFLLLEIPALIIMGIALLLENLFYARRKISYRCPYCKNEYKIPVYICPEPHCGAKHKRLRPGVFGIGKRRCVCGKTILPLKAKKKGFYWVYESVMKRGKPAVKRRKERFRFSELHSECPICGNQYDAGLTKPTSIALIGGAAAGKTTFKVAFGYTFLDEEAVKAGMECDFPDPESEREHERAIRCFKGQDIILGTNRGAANDISTFSFSLSNKKFAAPRMIHIYDMPGEIFESGDAKEGWRNYTFSEGMVFLIDPFSLPGIRDLLNDEVKTASMGICETEMNALIDSLINTLSNEKVRKKNGKFTIPVALTINKVDTPALKKMCGGDAVNALMAGCPEVFSDYFVTMDYVCRCFLARNDGIGFIANLDNNFSTVHFFFSSPMGYIPTAQRSRFRPVNVLPIMQWMMLRADRELAKVWKPDIPVNDLTDEQKQLYMTHGEYYEQYVVPLFIEEEGGGGNGR